MPEHVRVHVDGQAHEPRPARDASLHDAGAQTAAALAGEYGTLVDCRYAAALGEPAPDRVDGVAADRYDPGLAALAGDAHRAVTKVDVLEIEPEQLGQPKARRIEELHDRLVADAEPLVAAEFEQTAHRVGIQRHGQALARFRRLHARGRIVLELSLAQQEAEETSHGREPALDRRGRQPAPVGACGELADVLRIERLPAGDALRFAEFDQRPEIARVTCARVCGELPLVAQAREKAVDAARERPAHALRASIASLTSSPIRTRKSVLMVGRKRSVS